MYETGILSLHARAPLTVLLNKFQPQRVLLQCQMPSRTFHSAFMIFHSLRAIVGFLRVMRVPYPIFHEAARAKSHMTQFVGCRTLICLQFRRHWMKRESHEYIGNLLITNQEIYYTIASAITSD